MRLNSMSYWAIVFILVLLVVVTYVFFYRILEAYQTSIIIDMQSV
ncbi:MAG: hypothetical protein NTU81_00175 [Candidatus Nomurabacteria bacterium]|nr:hypothetical protein [Candidatus Nomurabacteria bacterium]